MVGCLVILLVGVVWSYRVVVSQAFWCQLVRSLNIFTAVLVQYNAISL